MTQTTDLIYKGHVLSATAVLEQDRYTAMLIVREPDAPTLPSGARVMIIALDGD